ncbi:hypothetical protein [Sphingomonas sp. CARO-RG-8B-R24-01]|uniref:hypothetical protein n=1 Tax=Sphingomonas sp. CARO-RG-8B-R24-01 TaxID=2914831 RepID=UPI001F597411|nr:hypothetical protein [Sphingomonas sp. CARO-RG-8B-R24-01]
MRDSNDGYWFVPKAFGIGATPVTWQGWALTIGFVVLAMLAVTQLPNRVAQTGVLLALILLFTLIAIRKTRGGWSWRWGERG